MSNILNIDKKKKLEELAEEMSEGFWSDDLESFEDNPQRELIMWVAKRIYEQGIKNGYIKAIENTYGND